MTSAIERAPRVWITGLAGAGKSTLARAVATELRARGVPVLLLDGDELTAALEVPGPSASYAAPMRLQRAWRMARLANLVANQGVTAVVATIALFHEVQHWNRQQSSPLVEVLLRAELPQLAERRPHLYGGQDTEDVVGVGQPAQFPARPELVIAQDWQASSVAANARRCLQLWERACAGAGTTS